MNSAVTTGNFAFLCYAFFACLFLLCPVAQAQLRWELKEIELHPTPAEAKAIAHYRFTNVGADQIFITSVKTSCNCCTKAAADKTRVEPRGTGEVAVVFEIGDKVGTFEKLITVDSSDVAEPRAVLALKVVIPQIFDVQPDFVTWIPGEPLRPKTMTVAVIDGFQASAVRVIPSDPSVKTAVSPIVPGKKYEIAITPGEVSKSTTAVLRIDATLPGEIHKTALAHVRIR